MSHLPQVRQDDAETVDSEGFSQYRVLLLHESLLKGINTK